ncbi:WxL domain-containing protein [Lacticaseibacillus nasuensis]|uniref:WxL domain-containing protein n=1 Tax=Lacticaseibacillus nasuensis JCM 17158 TaxID=1291734 RepID=A0A0R1K033_9LACO|nr:WxL domain-containing protein [Lacticaseibacillus nasuensis]KRK74001.1 hypothetical protein FD02_GL001835 [Lacticaseibacillus nasuensis JCM 17158]
MKHGLITLGAVAVAAALSLPATVHAAAPTTKTSTATVTVSVPAGDLTLEQAPNFKFASTGAESAATLKNTGDTAVKVDDERGTGAGWSLSLQLGKFSGLTTQPGYLVFLGDTAAATTAGNTAPTVSGVTQTAPGDSGVLLENAAPSTGTGESTLTMGNVTLNGVTVPAINATYTADLTWTLGTTQTSN